jgi:pyruvate carboxylase subunit B
MKYTAIINDKTYQVEIGAHNTVNINGKVYQVDFRLVDGNAQYSLLLDNVSWEALVAREGDEYRILIGGELHIVVVQDERTRKMAKAEGAQAAASGEALIKAPMPGLVRGVQVQVGDAVTARQGVVVLEAMKMENELRTPRAGTVKEVRVKAGDRVEQGQVLVVIK